MQIFVAKREPRITFAYSSAKADARDTLLRSGELSGKLAPRESTSWSVARNSFEGVLDRVRAEIEHVTIRTGPEEIEYRYTEGLVAEMEVWAQRLLPTLDSEMPGHISVGGISFDDMRRFWAALLALSNTHQLSHDLAAAGDIRKYPVRSLVLSRSRDEWVRLLSRLSKLPSERCETVLN